MTPRFPSLSAFSFALIAASCIVMFSSATDAGEASSCMVRIVGLSNVPVAVYSGVEMSVEVRIGTRTLFTTARKPVVKPFFGNRITARTAAARPLVFLVRLFEPKWVPELAGDLTAVSQQPDKTREVVVRPKRQDLDEDEVLAMGFDNLIGDYGPERAVKRRVDEIAVPVQVQAQVTTQVPSPVRQKPGRVSLKPVPIPTYLDDELVSRVLCKITVPWPPSEGLQSLPCGGVELQIENEMVGGR
jgi:hypothetical protein